MSDDRAEELISAAADGRLNDAERAELERLLETSPEARRLRDAFDRMESVLASAPEAEPPAGLRDQILNRISPRKRQRVRAAPMWSQWLQTGPVMRHGLSATVGVLLAVSVYESRQPVSDVPDITELVGTMAPGASEGSHDILGTHRFRADGVESRVQLERRDGALLLDIRVDAARDVEIDVDYSAAGLRLDALLQVNGSVESIQITDHVLRLRARGQRTLTALLHKNIGRPMPDMPLMRFRFTSNDELQIKEIAIP